MILLLLTAAAPLVIAFLIFVWRKYPFGPLWFFSSVVTGIIALFAAAFAQSFFPPLRENSGMGAILFKLFIQIALTEEGGRLLLLVPYFKAGERFGALGPGPYPSHALATGLAAGLGFAFMETLSYAQTDLRIALVRAFSASPLHAACGARSAQTAASLCRGKPDPKGFISALLIHGTYNFLVISPGIPAFMPVVLVLAVLVSAAVKIGHNGADNTY